MAHYNRECQKCLIFGPWRYIILFNDSTSYCVFFHQLNVETNRIHSNLYNLLSLTIGSVFLKKKNLISKFHLPHECVLTIRLSVCPLFFFFLMTDTHMRKFIHQQSHSGDFGRLRWRNIFSQMQHRFMKVISKWANRNWNEGGALVHNESIQMHDSHAFVYQLFIDCRMKCSTHLFTIESVQLPMLKVIRLTVRLLNCVQTEPTCHGAAWHFS